MENKNRVLLVLMFLWVVICFSSGEALAVSWNDAISGIWSEPTNWSGGVVPGPSDDVEITVDGTYTVTLDVDATIAGLTLGTSAGTQTLAATGHTLTINGASTINSNGVLNLVSSTLGGSGTLTNQGTMSMSNSTINADLVNEDSLTVSSTCGINGTFSNTSGGTLSVSYATLTVASGFTNQGAIELNGILTGGGTLITLINQGSINTAGSSGALYVELDNQGTLTLDRGLTLNQPSAAHTSSGTITVSGGNLVLTQSGTGHSFTNTGTIDIASGRSFTVNGGTLNHNGAFTGSGTLSVSAGTFNLATDLSNLMTLSLSGSELNGPGVLTNQGTMSMSNSTINADLVNEDSLTVSSTCGINGTFSNTSGGTLSVSYATLTVASGFTNQGAIELNGILTGGGTLITLINQGSINTAGSSGALYVELDNKGTLTLDRGLTLNQPSAVHTSSGTITVSGGNLVLTQSGTGHSFTNTGTIDIASGRSFTVNGGTLNHNGAFTGSGTLSVSAGTFHLTTDLSNLMTLSLSGSELNGPGVLTNQGTMSMSNSTINADLVNEDSLTVSSTCGINGTFSNTSGGTLSVSYATLTVASGFTNQGAIELNGILTGGGTLITLINQGSINTAGSSGALYVELDNQGTLTLDRGLTLNQPSAAHTSSGTITVSGGNLVLTQSGTGHSFTNTGTIDIASGRSFTVNGGTLNHNGAFTGSGTLSVSAGTFHLTTDLSNLMTLSLSGSELNGPGVLTNQGTMSMSNSTINADLVNEDSLTVSSTCGINGTFSNTSGGTLSVSYATLTVASGFTNQGAIELNGILTGGGTLITLINQGSINTAGSSGALYVELDNKGTLTLDRGLTLNQPSAVHTSSGTITVSGGNLVLTQSGTGHSFTNTGTIDIASGRSFTVNGGTLNHNGAFTGSGTLSVSAGTFNLATDLSNLMTLSLSGSELNGPGVLTNQGTMSMSNSTINADLVNEDSLTVSSTCGINGTFSNTSGGTLSVSYATLTVASGFTNQGAIELNGILTGGGTLITLINQGSINTAGSSGALYVELDNQGTLTLDRGLTLNQPSAAHTSSGTITVSGGNLTVTQSGTGHSFTNTGTIDIASGRSFTVNGGTLNHNGTFTGSGTLNVSGTRFTNAGTISPGTSPGILTVIGDCPQEYTAALNIEIGGLTAGTQYDRLDISGSAALAGTLNVTLINGFAPILYDTFPIVTYASHTGTFDTTNLPAPTDEVGWHIDYDATAIILSVISSTVIFTEDTLIDAGDTTYEGFHIVVGEGIDPVTLTINGTHGFASMTITDLATLTHKATDGLTTRSLDLDITVDVDIEPGGEINVDGLGYLGGRQPGNEDSDYGRTSGNVTTNGSAGGAGASHGGPGGDGVDGIIGSTYGDPLNPIEPGAGGGASSSDDLGGNGGGLIRLVVDGTLTNNGIISANGLSPGDYTGGGGAGGGIYLDVDTLSGDGDISANGGSGGTVEETGGGGGGRIAIWSNTYNFTGTLTASGGSGQNGGGDGEEGTACDMDNPSIETISFDECISELCISVITVDAIDPCEGSLTYEWDALDGGSITGEAAEVEFDPPDTGPHPCPYQVKVTVTSDVSGLSAEETIDIYVKLTGDANGDGVVNILDKVMVRNAFGTSGPPGWVPADVNCDGVVNILDKVKVRNQFGQNGCACPQ